MVKSIIDAEAYKTRAVFKKQKTGWLNISEFYYDTIQGEGHTIGQPAAFLRLAGCTLNCSYCDSKEVWRYGSPYSFGELFTLIQGTDLLYQLKHGQHLVITGGSPLLQQDRLVQFLIEFEAEYDFLPFIEIENECTIIPSLELIARTNIWNNSPKLTNSGVPAKLRYKTEVITALSRLHNSYFKFVLSHPAEWGEIYTFFIHPELIKKEQIILMPEGATREELAKNREMVVELAVYHNVRYCTREHIVLWNRKVGC